MTALLSQLPESQPGRVTSLLGANLNDEGCRFGLWAPRADGVELVLIDGAGRQRAITMDNSEGIWQVFVPEVRPTQRYGFRVHGPWSPADGLRANPAKLLIDPYARAITAGVDYSGPIHDHTAESNYVPDERDSALAVPLSVVVAPSEPPRPIARRRPMSESVIYEAHVKGMTQNNPAVPEHLRGTYAGLAYPAVIDHLRHIGVTAIELLPVHHFVSEPFLVRRGMTNYWGYNTLGFFSPHAAYCSVGTLGEQVREFQDMVSALHDAGIEVILDVVYNHTCEGGHDGPTLCYRGIDHRGYYRLTGDHRNDYDVTGCGNSLDTSQRDVRDMVLDSMRYWVQEMGIDGFRFDLAPALIRDERHNVDHEHMLKRIIMSDPIFDNVKLIAEPWDLGPYGYQVGAWGPQWSEWNDKYRDVMRNYWRGDASVRELATRVTGSADLFGHDGRTPSASVNLITAHDGFTMRDLVTYNVKHNEANGEYNRDGTDANFSWNCGVEGETDDPEINALRRRQVRNLLATMMLSRGVPMITAGDELGRTQSGNNNAYCQDNAHSWLDWNTGWSDVTDTLAELARLRASHPLITRDNYGYHEEIRDAAGNGLGRYNLAWLNGYAGQMADRDWNDPQRHLLGMYLSDATSGLIVWLHSDDEDTQLVMPPIPWGVRYRVIFSTADEVEQAELKPGDHMVMPARSVVVMDVDVPHDAPMR